MRALIRVLLPAIAVLIFNLALVSTSQAQTADLIYIVGCNVTCSVANAGDRLYTASSQAPATALTNQAITGLPTGVGIYDIDFRPATGQLYGLGSDSRLYLIDPTTAAATSISPGPFGTPLQGTAFDMDFNPTVDRIRVVSDARQNLRLNPDTGAIAAVDGTLTYAAADTNAAATPRIVGAAYTNSFAGATTTTLYDIDSNLDILTTQNPPNNGTLNTVGALGVNTDDLVGFDITSATNTGYAVLRAANVSHLYTINLTNGAATDLGDIITGQTPVGLAVAVQPRVLISEFRFRGPTPSGTPQNGGAFDEFIELYNNSNTAVTVQSVDGTAGWALVAQDGDTRATLPNGLTIPARAHYLVVNSNGYSLGNYGGPGRAQGNTAYTDDIGDDTGIALFRTTNFSNFSLATRIDAAGFQLLPGRPDGTAPTGGVAASLFREGAGLTRVGSSDDEYSLVRRMAITGLPQDTDNNLSDFVLVSTNASAFSTGAISTLGAPGPENLFSPIQRNATVKSNFIDPQCTGTGAATTACARVRDTNAVTNGQFGTLTFRRAFTNSTGGPVGVLRFRVVDITTRLGVFAGEAPSGVSLADLRLLSTPEDTPVTRTDGTPVTLRAMSVEEPPNQPLGGGLNSTIAVVSITPAAPLQSGETVNVQFTFGVMATGDYRAFVNTEAGAGALPTSPNKLPLPVSPPPRLTGNTRFSRKMQ